ncbi:hypothetical protein SAMN02927924_02853 [Sphingobium faniae]|nr:hypothetical protein SAMN02927924_02853 [Sphingobium faniae]
MGVTSQIAQAPILQMPEPLQTIFFWVTLVLAASVFLYSLKMARRDGSLVPPLLVIGAFTSIILETLVGYLGHVTHPSGGSIALFSAVDRTIPWHIALGYTFGFGVVYLIIYRQAMAGTIRRSLIWKTGAITVTCYYFGEIVGVSTGLWAYFEPAPLWIWKATAPLTWSFMNSSAELFGASLIAFLLPQLTGVRQLLVPVLTTMGTLMGHFGTNFILFNVMNASVSRTVMEAGGVATILLAMIMWWIASQLATANVRLAQTKG